MKALSIKQPWAWLIVHGGKDIENRSWRTKHRGRFLIHASKKQDKKAMKLFAQKYNPEDLVYGAIIGSVELVDVVENSDSKWFHGPIGFVLRDPKTEDIRHCNGKLNFFEVHP